jgi:hypothetical protein
VTFGEAMDRLYSHPGHSRDEWNDAAGAFLQNMLGGTPDPGPPYVHTFKLPQQPVYASSGKLVYRPPAHPAYTMEIRPVADVVREAGFGPVPSRIEVTYLTDQD